MPKEHSSKQSSKKRVKVKALPNKSKKLSAGQMKKVKGGNREFYDATRTKVLSGS